VKTNKYSEETKKSFIDGIVFFVFGLFLILYANIYLDKHLIVSINKGIGSAFMPKLVGYILMFLSSILIITSILKSKKTDNPANVKKIDPTDRKYAIRGWLTIIMLCVYGALLIPLGFIVSSIIYLFCQMVIMDMTNRSRKYMILYGVIALITPFLVYWIFVHGFTLMLPAGILNF
jgi:putative tricarboxylic transport membrane protein